MLKTSHAKDTCHHCSTDSRNQYPDHATELIKLRRVRGQVDGIERMISDRRYCPEILIQVRAAAAALKGIERGILGRHMRACVKDALRSKNTKEIETKIDELMNLMAGQV